jgi:hypothetical protein
MFHLIENIVAVYLMFPGMPVAMIASVVISGHPHGGDWSPSTLVIIAMLINFPCYLAISYTVLSFYQRRFGRSR